MTLAQLKEIVDSLYAAGYEDARVNVEFEGAYVDLQINDPEDGITLIHSFAPI